MLRAPCVLAVLSTALMLTALACGGDPPAGSNGFVDPDQGGRPDLGSPDTGDVTDEEPVETCDLELAAPGGPNLSVAAGSTAALTVLLADCDGIPPEAGTLVTFTTQGETGGAALQARNAPTDEGGVAFVNLRAGLTPATFDVLVETEGARSLTLHVTVSAAPSGTIEVTIAIEGTITFDSFSPLLYAATACDDLGPYGRPAALQQTAPVVTTSTHPSFTDVPVGSGYAVVVTADKDGGLLGYGCTDELSVSGGQQTDALVTVGEIPIVFTGVYALDNLFDMSDALPPSVATTLQIFDEMTDDDDLYGNLATEDYGLDPAAFLLDFVYRQFCCWEATGSNRDWDSCNAQSFQHPTGDLSALYLHSFFSWSGAQPIFTGACGALAFGANEAAQDYVQGLIMDNAPGAALDLLQIAGDLSRAFTDMHITSELRVADAYLTKNSDFTHELLTMIVDLHDLDGDLHEFEFALAEAGLTNLAYTGETGVAEGHILVIPEHSFRLDFGRLLHYIYLNGVLPLLDCDADGDGFTEPCESTADLFRTWIDCDSVGIWVEDNLGVFTADEGAAFCTAGLRVAGLAVEGQIAGATDRETVITLQGTTQAGALDERRRATELANGAWSGTLSEDSVEIGAFEGIFTGVRTGDL